MSARPGISVVLITRDEAARIRRCLESVRWADEIVVVDQHSTDGTAAICREYGARVVTRDMLAGFGDQKNFALAQATRPWILSLDADEEVTPALRREIETAVAAPGAHAGFRMPRLTSYLGRFIRHCGWYPSPVLRLARRGRARFTDALVHEELLVDGPIGDLGADLLHRSYDSLADHVRKLLVYTAYDARMLERRGERVRGLGALWRLALKPPAVFVRKYVAQGGFREGWHGFVLSAMAALVVLVNYVRLAELTGRLPTPSAPVSAAEPPTVLLLANFAEPVGGGEESLLALATRLDRQRIRPVASVPAEGEVARRLRALGVPVTVLPLPPVRPWRAARIAWTLSRLRALLAGERVALVHAQGGRGALYAALACRRSSGTRARPRPTAGSIRSSPGWRTRSSPTPEPRPAGSGRGRPPASSSCPTASTSVASRRARPIPSCAEPSGCRPRGPWSVTSDASSTARVPTCWSRPASACS